MTYHVSLSGLATQTKIILPRAARWPRSRLIVFEHCALFTEKFSNFILISLQCGSSLSKQQRF
ncbi:hypothetical protein PAHAL_4G087200 [Panicum hallii]|uniref:Uncharacterized protein n=1 Tax=Panicum hallii TaxID=206008 RepID=A0A2T8JCC1_9POAL|nr:hypothetical protein PAHAL_4G087200 [Panicum hallii]